eukprot:1613247-Alexandrium_andersonii.AAC.1
MGWDWVRPLHWTRPGLPDLPVLFPAEEWWTHQLRDGIRDHLWRSIATNRQGRGRRDFQGMGEHAANYYGSTALLRGQLYGGELREAYAEGITILGGALAKIQQGVLEGIL